MKNLGEKLLRNSQNIIFFLCLLILLALPFSKLALNLLIILLSLTWLACGDIAGRIRLLVKKPVFVLFTLYFVFYTFGLFYTSDIKEGLARLSTNLPILIFPLIFGTTNRMSRKKMEIIQIAFVFTCLLACIICITVAIIKNLHEGYNLVSIFKGFYTEKEPYRYQYFNFWYFSYEFLASSIGIQPMYLAFLLSLAFCICIHSLARPNKINFGTIKGAYYVSIAILLTTIFLLSVRIAILSTLLIILGLSLYILFCKKKALLAFSIFTITTLGALLLLYLNPITKERIGEAVNFSENNYKKDNWGGRSFRVAIWVNTLDVIDEHFFLGVGTGDGQIHLDRKFAKNKFNEGLGYNTHNEYLKVTLELGLLGLFVLLSAILVPLSKAIRKDGYLYVAFLCLMMLFFLTENVLSRQIGVVFYSFFNSLYASFYLYGKASNQ